MGILDPPAPPKTYLDPFVLGAVSPTSLPAITDEYTAFGGIAVLQDEPKTLILVERRAEVAGEVQGIHGKITIRTSTSQAKSWSVPATLLGETGKDFFVNRSVCVTPTGRILVFYVERTTGGASLENYVIYSDNHGVSWSAPVPTGHATMTTFSVGPITVIGNGRLLAAWYGTDGTNYSTYVVMSTNNGATWNAPVQVVTSTAITYGEAAFGYLGGEAIVGLMRAGTSTAFYQVMSTNNGATWSAPSLQSWQYEGPGPPTIVPFRTLSGERALACYYAIRAEPSQINVITATAAALLAGAPAAGWDTATIRTLANPPNADCGYVSAVHFSQNQSALVCWYEAEAGKAFIGPTNVQFAHTQSNFYQDSKSNRSVYSTFGALTSGVSNTALGVSAGRKLTTGSQNTALGCEALPNNTTGTNNTAVGYQALIINVSGSSNTALGCEALKANSGGNNNTALGKQALVTNVSGAENVGVGGSALFASTTSGNTAVGFGCLKALSTGATCTALGMEAGAAMTTNGAGLFLGYKAGKKETEANRLYIANSETEEPLIKGVFPNASLLFNATELGFFKHALGKQGKVTGKKSTEVEKVLITLLGALAGIGLVLDETT